MPPADASSGKAKDVLLGNDTAAKGAADAVSTSLGLRGMDNMGQPANGGALITDDGTTMLEKTRSERLVAQTLVQLFTSQDTVAGDGTTTVAAVCGALLNATLDLLGGVHPSRTSHTFAVAQHKAPTIVERAAFDADLANRDAFIEAPSTSVNSKVVSQCSSLLTLPAVEPIFVFVSLQPQSSLQPLILPRLLVRRVSMPRRR